MHLAGMASQTIKKSQLCLCMFMYIQVKADLNGLLT